MTAGRGVPERAAPGLPESPGHRASEATGHATEAAAADRARAAPCPAWDGREGCVGYLAKMFPRLSETFILDEVLALRRHGVPVRVYSLQPPTRDGKVHPAAAALAGEVEVLPEPRLSALGGVTRDLARCFRVRPRSTLRQVARLLLWPSPRSFRRLARAAALAARMRRDRVAHLHAAWAHTPASVARIASRLSGVRWSMGAHAKDVHLSRPESLAKKVAEARFTLACSAATRDLLARLAPPAGDAPAPEVTLLHHGVDLELFAPGERPPEAPDTSPPVVLSVGRLVPKKGFDLLLEAVQRLRRRGLRFCLEIVGDGPERGRLVQRVAELGLGEDVRLLGARVRDEVRAAMRRATCLALASRVGRDGDRDGIPNALAEAMAAGLPVVATRLPGIEELVADRVTGLLVPPEDPEALAEAIAALLATPRLARRLGEAARAAVARRFDARPLAERRARRFARALGIERVLYLSADRGVPARGHKGASVHLRSLVAAWRSMEVETVVLTTAAGPAAGPSPAARLVEARAAGAAAGLAARLARRLGGPPLERAVLRLLDVPVLHRRGVALIRAFHPDLLYERYALSAVAGALLARRLHVPYVVEMNAPLAAEEARFRGLALGWLARALEGWILRRADRVVVVSPALARHARALGVGPERLLVLENGVDPSRFGPGRDGSGVRARLGLDGACVAGFAGSLKPWHGVGRLIAAAARAAPLAPDLRVLVIGEGPERPALERQAERLGMRERVRFVGAVPHDEVGAHLAACDLLVAPYEPDPRFYFSPLKLAEYRAAGRPVVAAAVGPLAALDETCGTITFPPGDEAALASALARLAADPGRRAALARTALAAPPPTWRQVAGRTLAAAEEARRESWGWSRRPALGVGYVLKMFPRFSETFVLREMLELERRGARLVAFSLKPPDEPLWQPGLERLAAPILVIPRLAGAGLLAHLWSHAWCCARRPRRYAAALRFARGRRSRSAWRKFLLAAWVAREGERRGVRHFHAHFASGPARLAKFASLLGGAPFSFTAHAKDLYWAGHQHGRNHKLKKRVRLAAFVASISDCNRRFIEGLGFKVPRRRLVTIYNGLDLEEWRWERPAGRPLVAEDPPLLLAVGRLVEKKGFHDLVEACARLRERGVAFRCVIAGAGPQRPSLEAHVRAQGLEPWVELPGPVPQDRLRALFRRAAALVQPSLVGADGDRDGIPTVILEAMALGLPVVATPVSGIGEAITHGESGLLSPPRDPGGLAEAIRAVLADEGLCARLSAAARARMEERFDLRRNAEELLRLMKRAARMPVRAGARTEAGPAPAAAGGARR